MPRYKPQFWNRTFLKELFGASMLVAGGAGFWTADWWAPHVAHWLWGV